MVNGNDQKQEPLVICDTSALFGGKVLILSPEIMMAMLESSELASGRVNPRVFVEKLTRAIDAPKP